MRALAVLSPSINSKTEEHNKYYLEIDSKKIPIALIEVPDTEFDENDENNANFILIRKEGFSLNYRDLGVVENAWNMLSRQNTDSYYPIGSDFCGQVIKKGRDVKGLQIGDRVIGDCTFPFVADGITPGIPSNHSSKELEVLHYRKVKKIPETISVQSAAGMSIGTQTANSMIEKAAIKEGSNVLITSVTSNTSLFLLSFIKEKKCKVYGLSHSGEKINAIKEAFPFIEEIFSFQANDMPKDIVFDAILDPFADTYIEKLVGHLNYDAKYVTCGIFNQSSEKYNSESSQKNITGIIAQVMSKNASIVGNCLGTEQNLNDGINLLSTSKAKILVDSTYSDEEFKAFIEKSYHKDRFGKAVMVY